MKKILMTAVLALIFFAPVQKNAFSYLITIQHPSMCPDDPSFLIYPNSSIQCEFSIASHHPGDIDTIAYTLFIEQRGVVLELGQGIAVARETVIRHINIQNFTLLCFNEPAIIRIHAVRYNGYGAVFKQNSYFISYKNGSSCNYSAVTNGNALLMNQGIGTFYRRTPCSAASSGNYATKQYKVSFILNGNFNLNDSIPVIQASHTLGYNGALPNYQIRSSFIEYMTNTEIKFSTFVYDLFDIAGQYIGWVPCRTNEAAVVYKWIKKPVILNLSQFPVPLTPLNSTGIVRCNMFSGNELSFEWKDSNDVNNVFSIMPYGNVAVVRWHPPADNLLNSNKSDLTPPYEVYCRAFNAVGYSEWKRIRIYYTLQNTQCPVINYSDSLAGKITDNSVLPASEYFLGKTVKDYYMLMNPLLANSDRIEFSLTDNGNKFSDFDEVRLFLAETAPEHKIAVTNEGNVISYDDSFLKSSVILNDYLDMTDDLQDHDDNIASFKKNDKLSVTTDLSGNNLFLILIPIVPVNKDKPAGKIIFSERNEIEFFSRDNESVICVKLPEPYDQNLSIVLSQDVSLNQILITKNTGRIKVRELQPETARHNILGDIIEFISKEDGKKIPVDSINYADFSFKNIVSENRNVRFILKTTGETGLKDFSNADSGRLKSDELTGTEFKLFNNHPNPFNPFTKIKFSIPKSGHVKIKIYDVLGNETQVLVNETRSAGLHSVYFNGSNFPSGVYFYKLEYGDYTDIKRMILLK
ncbi:MAG TPA: T9SS type A sorting domain-containing protein [Ignavibacteria bacterium]|nr:T9SS type A sorting domain-containing protein [Ignavibacteria bacterium]HRJ98805.1 T9SS type A sorting domain-containing protein [Ignavibacteria bacterium]